MSAAEEQRDSFQFEFSALVPAGTSADDDFTVERRVPYDGRIITFVIGWPDGANNLVGIKLFNADTDEKLYPYDDESEFVGANDFTHPFDLRVSVQKDHVLVVQFVNNDQSNEHFMNAILTIETVDAEVET